uniref:hypothetical protein n=1 Tax=Agathobacter sp. TaxID=2021311 RepID=UPI0040562777
MKHSNSRGVCIGKYIVFILALSAVLNLVGCNDSSSNNNEKQLSVYSFKGNNEQIEISNGVIVLDTDEEIFDGGNLRVIQEEMF